MKSKQKIAIGLALFYVLSVMGVALSVHFCGGKLAEIAVFAKETSCKYCKDTPAEKKTDNCCKDTLVTAKVDHSHQMSSSLTLPQLFTVDLILPYPIFKQTQWIAEQASNSILNKVPPLDQRVGLVLLHQSFRI